THPGRRRLAQALSHGARRRWWHDGYGPALARAARCAGHAAPYRTAAPVLAQQRLAGGQPVVRDRAAAGSARRDPAPDGGPSDRLRMSQNTTGHEKIALVARGLTQ